LIQGLGAATGRWLVLVGLLAGLSLGRVSGLFVAGPAVDAGMILALGLLLAAAALCAIGFGLAVIRGAANAGDLAPETDRVLFAAGLAGAGYAAITLIMALTLTFRLDNAGATPAWQTIAIRALGGRIAAIALMMTGLAFAS
jgi:urease accessory protein